MYVNYYFFETYFRRERNNYRFRCIWFKNKCEGGIAALWYHTIQLSYSTYEINIEFNKNKDYNWELRADLKLIAILLGLRGGFTKHCCFFCMWDRRVVKYTVVCFQKILRETVPLMDPKNSIKPPLHINLGSIKLFLKAMTEEGDGFLYFETVLSKTSDTKFQEEKYLWDHKYAH